MESLSVRYLRTSWWSVGNRTSERSEGMRFLIQTKECLNTVRSHFPCCIMFIIYILRLKFLFYHPATARHTCSDDRHFQFFVKLFMYYLIWNLAGSFFKSLSMLEIRHLQLKVSLIISVSKSHRANDVYISLLVQYSAALWCAILTRCCFRSSKILTVTYLALPCLLCFCSLEICLNVREKPAFSYSCSRKKHDFTLFV